MGRYVCFTSLFHGALLRRPSWLGFHPPNVDCGFRIPGTAVSLSTSAPARPPPGHRQGPQYTYTSTVSTDERKYRQHELIGRA